MKAAVLHTYSSFSPITPEWMVSNDTFKTELISLQPATTYNITVSAVSDDGAGPPAWSVVQTQLAGNLVFYKNVFIFLYLTAGLEQFCQKINDI